MLLAASHPIRPRPDRFGLDGLIMGPGSEAVDRQVLKRKLGRWLRRTLFLWEEPRS